MITGRLITNTQQVNVLRVWHSAALSPHSPVTTCYDPPPTLPDQIPNCPRPMAPPGGQPRKSLTRYFWATSSHCLRTSGISHSLVFSCQLQGSVNSHLGNLQFIHKHSLPSLLPILSQSPTLQLLLKSLRNFSYKPSLWRRQNLKVVSHNPI